MVFLLHGHDQIADDWIVTARLLQYRTDATTSSRFLTIASICRLLGSTALDGPLSGNPVTCILTTIDSTQEVRQMLKSHSCGTVRFQYPSSWKVEESSAGDGPSVTVHPADDEDENGALGFWTISVLDPEITPKR